MLCKKSKIFQALKALLFVSLLSTGVLACAKGLKKAALTKRPASQPVCTNCSEFIEEGRKVIDQLTESEREVDPENLIISEKQAKVRMDMIKLIDQFLTGRSIKDTLVMDAVFDVWMTVASYERNSEVGESNFEHFKHHLKAMHLRLAQRIASAKSGEEKSRLNLIRLSLDGAENAFSGEAQDGP